MMVAVSPGAAQRLALGSAVPIRSVPLPAWSYMPQPDRPAALPAGSADAVATLAQRTGALAATIRHAPGARDVVPRLTGWSMARAAAAEGLAWSGDRHGAAAAAVEGTRTDAADACWRASLGDWASVTGLAAAVRRAPAWIGPSIRLPAGGSTVPPPPHLLKDAIASWQRAMDTSATLGESALVRGILDAAWTLWTMHFLQPVEGSSGLLARLAAARVFACRTGLQGMPIVPVEGASPLRADESADLSATYDAWMRASITALSADADLAIAGLERALEGRAALLDAASAMRAPRHPTMLAHALVAQPRMTMQDAARAMGISFRAAQAVMDKFLECGLVHEDTGRRRDRIYVCARVLFADVPQPHGTRLPDPSVR
jgi:hypothetical protein